jgi:hypothetical protein
MEMVATGGSRPMGDQEHIRELLREINRSWLDGDFDALQKLLHEKVVTVRPGFGERAEGRESCIQSYKDFVRSAAVKRFDESDHQIDVCGTTAVATYRFDITYEMGGREFHEIGRDIVVLRLEGRGWQVVWRTLLPLSRDLRDRSVTI